MIPALVILLAAGLAFTMPAPVSESVTKKITLTLTDDTAAKCGIKAGCAVKTPKGCEIVAPRPKDYLDHFGLEILGHEVCHCFYGADHALCGEPER